MNKKRELKINPKLCEVLDDFGQRGTQTICHIVKSLLFKRAKRASFRADLCRLPFGAVLPRSTCSKAAERRFIGRADIALLWHYVGAKCFAK